MKIDYTRKEAGSTLKIFVWKDMTALAEPVTVTADESPFTIPPDFTSHYEFEENLTDSVTNETTATVAPTNIDGTTTETAAYADGYTGKAVSFNGTTAEGVNYGTGINLGKVITDSKYTVAFRMKANAFTFGTAGVFINSGTKASENWLSAPFGSQTNGSTMIWSRKLPDSHLPLDSTGTMSVGKWHHVTVAVNGSDAALYIDGVKTGSGNVANTVSADTDTYLGVNFWDTPFNGLIDDLYIYNGATLTDEQIVNLYEATK